MTLWPADSQFISPLFGDAEISEIFSEPRFIRMMLDVEAALASVQGRLGLIPFDAASEIVAGAASLEVDAGQFHAGIEQAGVPVSELVRQLRAHLGPGSADYVHWGATTQDIMDTALVLQIRAALAIIEPTSEQVIRSLTRLADSHRETLMVGRTHGQQAVPISFGLKVASWMTPLLRHRERLAEIKRRLLVVQFGGAAGTLAAIGRSGPAVQEALAADLDLAVPVAPWHTQRDSLAEIAGWLSLMNGSLAKMAQDIILMAQSEVEELRETADLTRGGSSTMPQKSNPVVSELIVAAARTNATLLANMHQALIQEHERATHGWQLEWLTLPQMINLTAISLKKALFLSQNLVVDERRMRDNVNAANGLILAESITYALSPTYMSRTDAKELVGEACQLVVVEKRHLVDIVREKTNAPLDWESLKDAAAYTGSAAAFIDRVLRQAEADVTSRQGNP
jgi:3-carboxy-cis,cis-muconate cycloisomerase